MKITIFGLAGSGTSILGKVLAKELNYKFYSTGDIMREEAKKRNMSIYEFDEFVKLNSKIDINLDKKVLKIGKEQDNFIFDSRLSWYFIPSSIKICLNCNTNIRFKRVAERENVSISVAKKITTKRERIIENRYLIIYPQINYPPNEDKFDLVLDSTNDSVVDLIKKIKKYLSKKNT